MADVRQRRIENTLNDGIRKIDYGQVDFMSASFEILMRKGLLTLKDLKMNAKTSRAMIVAGNERERMSVLKDVHFRQKVRA